MIDEVNAEFDGKAANGATAEQGTMADATPWDALEIRALITGMLTTEPEPFQFIIKDFLAQGVCGFLYGEGGSYKSLAALWLCVQLAAKHVCNSKWLGRFPLDGEPIPSMFCSVEDMSSDLHHRLRPVIKSLCEMRLDVTRTPIESAIAENVHLIPREIWMRDGLQYLIDTDGNTTSKLEQVAAYAKDHGIRLIVIDTLSRVSPLDENDNSACAHLVSALERLRDMTGATVLVVAHTSKANRGGQTDTHGQNSLRGGGALLDNARFGLWFKALPSQNGKERLEIINAKTFRCKRAEKFKVEVDFPVFKLSEDDASGEDDLMNAVVEDVKANPGTTQYKTRTRLKKRKTLITQGFKDAIEEGKIFYKGKGKGYFINE